MPDDVSLAHFQATLLDLLDRGSSPQEIVRELQGDPRLSDYAAYVATFEPRMVEVAIELIAKWGRRDGGNLVTTANGDLRQLF
jgi:hypothetical protein